MATMERVLVVVEDVLLVDFFFVDGHAEMIPSPRSQRAVCVFVQSTALGMVRQPFGVSVECGKSLSIGRRSGRLILGRSFSIRPYLAVRKHVRGRSCRWTIFAARSLYWRCPFRLRHGRVCYILRN